MSLSSKKGSVDQQHAPVLRDHRVYFSIPLHHGIAGIAISILIGALGGGIVIIILIQAKVDLWREVIVVGLSGFAFSPSSSSKEVVKLGFSAGTLVLQDSLADTGGYVLAEFRVEKTGQGWG